MTELSEELLMAYIDGQLDKPQASVVGQMLSRDTELAGRVRRLQDTQAQFLELFGALVREGPAYAPAPLPPMQPEAQAQAKPRPKRGQPDSRVGDPAGFVTAGVASLLVVFGASLGFTISYYSGITRQTPPMETAAPRDDRMVLPPGNWVEHIATMHAFFTPETLTASRDSQTNPDLVRFQLGKLSSHAVALPDFSQNGLRFVRAQALNYNGHRLMQLVYAGKTDPLVAVYMMAGEGDEPVKPGRFNDVKTVSWIQGGLRFLIAANMTAEELRAMAVVAQAQLGKN